jgi:hypothetical protein
MSLVPKDAERGEPYPGDPAEKPLPRPYDEARVDTDPGRLVKQTRDDLVAEAELLGLPARGTKAELAAAIAEARGG